MKAQFNAKVISITKITDEIRVFKIKLNDEKFLYKAGQFAVLGLPLDKTNPDAEWVCRAYSIASAPSEDATEFYIVLVQDGLLTTRLFALQEGDEIYMSPKAAGLTSFEGIPEDSNIVFVSTGTGVAPFVSILREHKKEIFNGKRKIGLFHCVRHEPDLAYRGDFEKMANDYAEFKYYPVVSRGDSNWKGLTGHVQDLIGENLTTFFGETPFNPEKNYAFICGNQKMVDSVSAVFLEHGFKQTTVKEHGNLRFDKH